jgi:hypothetical protein
VAKHFGCEPIGRSAFRLRGKRYRYHFFGGGSVWSERGRSPSAARSTLKATGEFFRFRRRRPLRTGTVRAPTGSRKVWSADLLIGPWQNILDASRSGDRRSVCAANYTNSSFSFRAARAGVTISGTKIL